MIERERKREREKETRDGEKRESLIECGADGETVETRSVSLQRLLGNEMPSTREGS